MTTIKEFEERKKEIAIKLNDALDAMLELKPNLASNIVADQIKAIHKLQPPRPTCATCEYCNDVVKWGELEFQCRNQNVPGNAADRNMGCIHHSDYGEVKDE